MTVDIEPPPGRPSGGSPEREPVSHRTLDLSADRPRPATRRAPGGAVPFALPEDVRAALGVLAREEGTDPATVLLAAFAALLVRHAGREAFSLGWLGSGDDTPRALGVDATGDSSFRELVGRLADEVAGEPGEAGEPHPVLFARVDGTDEAPAGLRDARYDLALTVAAGDGEAGPLRGALRYDADLFDRTTVLRLAHRLATLAVAGLGAPETPLSRLPVATGAEAHQAGREWNDTGRALAPNEPPNERLDTRIAAQTERSPERIALVAGSEHLSYEHLARRVRELADRLRGLGVGPEVRVGVCAERSAELVIGLRAVLAAGGAYVPLDPEYPADRLAYMVKDAAAPVVLTTRELRDRLPVLSEGGARVVLLDIAREARGSGGGVPLTPRGERGIEGERGDLGQVPVTSGGGPAWGGGSSESLAYTIYTSGSTGRPKGAMNAHSGIVNRLLWMRDEYGLGDGDRVLQKTPFSFDVSVWELFLPPLSGATLVMAKPGGHQEPVYLVETVEREAITTIHFVPSMLQIFVQAVATGSGRRVCPACGG